MTALTANQITAHNAGWRTQFRFAGGVSWPGVCEFHRSAHMKSRGLIFLPVFVCGVILISSCTPFHYETSRSVTIDRAAGQIAIRRQGHYMAAVSPEGSFPEWNNEVRLIPSRPLPDHGTLVLRIPTDAKAEFGQIETGELKLDLDTLKATVRFKPSDYWQGKLKLDGIYPVTMK